MQPLILERTFAVPIDEVFEHISRSELLLKWWGPEGMTCHGNLDFAKPGPWNSTMVAGNGSAFKVSGQVTSVKRPNLVAFTWGWHDENDARGHESHVMIELSEEGTSGTKMILTHQGLENEESAARHSDGWESTLRKLLALLS